MHFRERGSTVQLIRSTYNPETKRPKHEVVGRLSRSSPEVPLAVLERLSEGEREEVAAYMERAHSLDLLRRRLAAHDRARTVADVVEYARSVQDEAESDHLQAIFAEAV